jgi:hypothetical protein|eukprot:COSAG06_NODE_588_length_13995_cov_37.217401_12_plen_293_part_00
MMGDPPAYGDELTALSECVMANAPDVCICMPGGMCENYGGDRYCYDMGCAEWEGCMMGRPNHGNDDDDMGMGPGMGMGPTGEPYDPSGPEHGDGPDGGGTSGGMSDTCDDYDAWPQTCRDFDQDYGASICCPCNQGGDCPPECAAVGEECSYLLDCPNTCPDGGGTSGGDAQPCPTEMEACVADTDCATIMQQENNEEACAGNTLCAAIQSCMIASAMQGQPCGDETTACFTDDTCLGLVQVPEGQDFDMEACNANALCGPWLTCQFANSGDGQDPWPLGMPLSTFLDRYFR